MLVGADRVDRLRALGEAGDDAALDQRVERALHAVGRVELELVGRRQRAPADVVDEVLQRDHQLGRRVSGAVAAAEQRQRRPATSA